MHIEIVAAKSVATVRVKCVPSLRRSAGSRIDAFAKVAKASGGEPFEICFQSFIVQFLKFGTWVLKRTSPRWRGKLSSRPANNAAV